MKTLLLIDVQNDFLPGGALAVREGDQIVPILNTLMPDYDLVVATQDWHPADHGSFAVNHPGGQPFQQAELGGLPQTLWPSHCVQNTGGALFAPGLQTQYVHRVFTKGMDPGVDSYSGFYDNGKRHSTGLASWLRGKGVRSIDVAGLATDYCVKFTVLDALADGFAVRVLTEACRGVDLTTGDCERALEEMREAGADLDSVLDHRDHC
jgi:nicotinamidase/pyrazinamidase